MGGSEIELSQGTLFIDRNDVVSSFDWGDAVEALRDAYAQDASDSMFPPRTMARGSDAWLRTLSGVAPDGGLMGAKMIAANAQKNRQMRASYLIALFDQQTVELRALMDGNAITGFRTAGTTAVALDALARPGAVSVGILGTGFEAQNHLRALASLREITSVSVFSPNPDSRARFVETMVDLDVAGQDSARAVVETAPDILICAARSRDEQPLFDGDWLSPRMTVASIGSTLPEQREIDPRTLERAELIVADMPEEVEDETGDMIAAKEAGLDLSDKVVALADLIGGRHPGRQSDDAIVIYKSVGGAIQDIAIATMCYARAQSLGLGYELSETIRPVLK